MQFLGIKTGSFIVDYSCKAVTEQVGTTKNFSFPSSELYWHYFIFNMVTFLGVTCQFKAFPGGVLLSPPSVFSVLIACLFVF